MYNVYYDYIFDEEEKRGNLVVKICDEVWHEVFLQVWGKLFDDVSVCFDDEFGGVVGYYEKNFKNEGLNIESLNIGRSNIVRANLQSWLMRLKEDHVFMETLYNLDGKCVRKRIKFKLPSVEEFLKKRKCFKCFSDSIFIVINQDKHKEEITLGCKKCGCNVNFEKSNKTKKEVQNV